MTREQYISMRERGNFNIVHEYYSERFDHTKHKPFLSLMELAQFLPASGRNVNKIFEDCCRHYDEVFNIVRLLNKDGNLIKTL